MQIDEKTLKIAWGWLMISILILGISIALLIIDAITIRHLVYEAIFIILGLMIFIFYLLNKWLGSLGCWIAWPIRGLIPTIMVGILSKKLEQPGLIKYYGALVVVFVIIFLAYYIWTKQLSGKKKEKKKDDEKTLLLNAAKAALAAKNQDLITASLQTVITFLETDSTGGGS